ncbi:hypothetical protein [Metabacillus sp. Hm71]
MKSRVEELIDYLKVLAQLKVAGHICTNEIKAVMAQINEELDINA